MVISAPGERAVDVLTEADEDHGRRHAGGADGEAAAREVGGHEAANAEHRRGERSGPRERQRNGDDLGQSPEANDEPCTPERAAAPRERGRCGEGEADEQRVPVVVERADGLHQQGDHRRPDQQESPALAQVLHGHAVAGLVAANLTCRRGRCVGDAYLRVQRDDSPEPAQHRSC